MTDEERIKRDILDRLINPPAIVGPDTVVLCPPLTGTAGYMKYIKDNKEHYRKFFGLEPGEEFDDEA